MVSCANDDVTNVLEDRFIDVDGLSDADRPKNRRRIRDIGSVKRVSI